MKPEYATSLSFFVEVCAFSHGAIFGAIPTEFFVLLSVVILFMSSVSAVPFLSLFADLVMVFHRSWQIWWVARLLREHIEFNNLQVLHYAARPRLIWALSARNLYHGSFTKHISLDTVLSAELMSWYTFRSTHFSCILPSSSYLFDFSPTSWLKVNIVVENKDIISWIKFSAG